MATRQYKSPLLESKNTLKRTVHTAFLIDQLAYSVLFQEAFLYVHRDLLTLRSRTLSLSKYAPIGVKIENHHVVYIITQILNIEQNILTYHITANYMILLGLTRHK